MKTGNQIPKLKIEIVSNSKIYNFHFPIPKNRKVWKIQYIYKYVNQ